MISFDERIERLRKLKSVSDSALITAAEFAAEKAALLNENVESNSFSLANDFDVKIERLSAIKQLHDSALLTDDEYDTLRVSVVNAGSGIANADVFEKNVGKMMKFMLLVDEEIITGEDFIQAKSHLLKDIIAGTCKSAPGPAPVIEETPAPVFEEPVPEISPEEQELLDKLNFFRLSGIITEEEYNAKLEEFKKR